MDVTVVTLRWSNCTSRQGSRLPGRVRQLLPKVHLACVLFVYINFLLKPLQTLPYPALHSLTLRSLTPARACWALPSLQLPGCAVLDCPFLQPQSMTLAQVAFGLLPTWPLHLQRLSGYGELQLARLATLLLAHHGGNQVVVFSSGS